MNDNIGTKLSIETIPLDIRGKYKMIIMAIAFKRDIEDFFDILSDIRFALIEIGNWVLFASLPWSHIDEFVQI